MTRVLMTHQAFEAKDPTEVEAAEAFENARIARHIHNHGTADGYRPGREFPCPGSLRVVGETPNHLIVECDACRYETSFRKVGSALVTAASTEESTAW